ncbi:MAG: hypothetical protein ACKVOL_11905 [Novosphingobium sp.]
MLKIKSILGAVPVLALLLPLNSAAAATPAASIITPARPVAKASVHAGPVKGPEDMRKHRGEDACDDAAHRKDVLHQARVRDDD